MCFPFPFSILLYASHRDAGTTLTLGWWWVGEGLPGVQGNSYPKLKTHMIWPTMFFFLETQVHVQKQTKIIMNDIDSPKLGGPRPHSFHVGGTRCPNCPPPVPAYLASHSLHFSVKQKVILNTGTLRAQDAAKRPPYPENFAFNANQESYIE